MSTMNSIRTSYGVNVSYVVHGNVGGAPPLVLVHGGFSDHRTNWEFVLPSLEQEFAVYAIARRGRGQTDDTPVRQLKDEANDVVELIRSIRAPVFLLGHSYGAHVALLAAASSLPGSVRRLILYEPPAPDLLGSHIEVLESFARQADWSGLSYKFFGDVLQVPTDVLDALKHSELWQPIVADARATMGDLRALSGHYFQPESLSNLHVPVMLQIGSESPRHLYATDALAAVLPDCRIDTLSGQAHEGMTTAPEQYVQSLARFLKDGSDTGRAAAKSVGARS